MDFTKKDVAFAVWTSTFTNPDNDKALAESYLILC